MLIVPFHPSATGVPGWHHLLAGYLASGLLLHVTTVIALAALTLVAMFMDAHPLTLPTMSGIGLAAVFTQLDARSRFQEFKRIRDQLIRFGPDRRIFRSASGSRCRRDAALAAARRLGWATMCRSCFAAAGYRWYHLLPDRVCQRPGVLLTAAFWRATFFTPGYRSRYPFPSEMETSGIPIQRVSTARCRQSECG